MEPALLQMTTCQRSARAYGPGWRFKLGSSMSIAIEKMFGDHSARAAGHGLGLRLSMHK